MSFRVHREGELEYLTSDVLDGAAHCFSTRFGGVSEGALASLNLGTHRGDRPENVLENYARLGRAVGFAPEETVFTKQVHSAIVERVGRADCGRGLQREAEHGVDGLVTNEPGVALTIFSADCTPVLLFDPIARAIGAAHAGWRGTAAGIAARAVEAMQREFGCRPENIRAAIGPCIGPCCFETDADVPDAMRAALGSEAGQAIRPAGAKFYVDLKRLNAIWLRRAGVTCIDVSADCTACQPQRFWSHRRVGNARGSLAAIIRHSGPESHRSGRKRQRRTHHLDQQQPCRRHGRPLWSGNGGGGRGGPDHRHHPGRPQRQLHRLCRGTGGDPGTDQGR